MVAPNNTRTHKFSLGDGATMCLWSDRHAGTVVSITPSGKTITWKRDKARRVDGNGMSDAQQYEYERDPHGAVRRFRRTKHGWKELGGSSYLAPGRREFYDFSF